MRKAIYMPWACVVKGTRPQVLTDDVIAGKSIKMNFQFYTLCSESAKCKTDQSFTVQIGNDTKHTAKATQHFLNTEKWDIFQ